MKPVFLAFFYTVDVLRELIIFTRKNYKFSQNIECI